MTFRLSVINPNSDRAVTEYLVEAATRALPPGSVVEGVDCPGSPAVLETALDSVQAGPAVVEAARRAGEPDAFMVACFGNPALAALREITAAPVVGLGDAALIEASLVTGRFGVITTLERGVPALWSQLDAAGAGRACAGVRAAEAAPGGGDLLARLTWIGELLLADGADGVVLACAGFGHLSDRLTAALGVPVCAGTGVAAGLAYGLVASGTQTSKRGRYGWSAAPAATEG